MSNLISQSQVDSYLSCKRKHWYSFGIPAGDGTHGLQPKSHSDSLNRGNLGHAALEVFYTELQGHSTVKEAEQATLMHLAAELQAKPDSFDLIAQITGIIRNYIEAYGEDDMLNWQILAIEQEFRYEIPGTDLVFPFKPDLIVRDIRDRKVWIVDHKFLFNFYQDRVLGIMPQMPKYAYALRALGYDIHDGLYNMCSTRPNVKTNPFKRQPLKITDAQCETFWMEQVNTMGAIDDLKTQAITIQQARAVRTASSFNCANCMFLDLCTAEAANQPGVDLMKRSFFEPNSYGYGKDEKDV